MALPVLTRGLDGSTSLAAPLGHALRPLSLACVACGNSVGASPQAICPNCLGPLIINIAGPQAVILIVAVLYLAAAAFCFTLPASPPPARAVTASGPHPVGETQKALGSTIAQPKLPSISPSNRVRMLRTIPDPTQHTLP